MTTYAWLESTKKLSSNLDYHIYSWNVELRRQSDNMKLDPNNVNIDLSMYPDVTIGSEVIEVINNGEVPFTVDIDITKVKFLNIEYYGLNGSGTPKSTNYITFTDNSSEIIGENKYSYINRDYLNDTHKDDTVFPFDGDFPFYFEFISPTTPIEENGGKGEITILYYWTGDDDYIDSIWEDELEEYLKNEDNDEDSALQLGLKLKTSQKLPD